jgi:hypothetical protein
MALTHAELVARAGAWLRTKGCKITFTELVSLCGENPDAIGWRDSGCISLLIECKTSRADFHADKHKMHRRADADGLRWGMGRFRYYLCPPGVIRVEDLPPKWGLLWCHPKKIELVRGKDPLNYGPAEEFVHQVSYSSELQMMFSALNRLRIDMGDAAFRDRVHLSYVERQRERREQGGAA